MNLANKQSSKLKREEIGKVEIENLKKEILELKARASDLAQLVIICMP